MPLAAATAALRQRLLRGGAVAVAGWLASAGMALAQDAGYAVADTYTPVSISYGEPRPGFTPREQMPGGLSLQAVGTETAYFDTNPLLLTSGAKPLWGSITTPELIVNSQTPTTSVYSDTLVNANAFNQSNFDSNDLHSALNVNSQSQRWGLGMQDLLDYDTTRSSELSDFSFKTTPVRHVGLQLGPQVSYNILPTDQLQLAGSYQVSHYDSVFTDYQTIAATPSYSHTFDQLNTGTVSLQAQRYTALSGPSNTVDTLGPSIGWNITLSQRLKANATIGLQMTRQSGANIASRSWTTQYTFGGGLTYKGEQDSAGLTATRQQYPFGNGTEALLTTLQATATHKLNRRFALGGSVSYQYADYQATSAGSLNALTSASGNLDYHATDTIDIVGQYQYRLESLVGTSATAHENMVTLSLTFHPKAWTM